MIEEITIGWFFMGILGVFLEEREDAKAGRPVRANSVFLVAGGAIVFISVIILMNLDDTES